MKTPDTSLIASLSKRLAITLGLITGISLVGCGDSSLPEPKEVIRPAKLLLLGEPNSSSIRNFPAVVEASEQSALAFRVSGELNQLPVKAGQQVSQGQLLAQLDATDFQLQVDDRQAQYNLAKAEYQRFKKMLDKKLIAISTVDQKKAQYLSAKSALDLAKQDLAYTKLIAPFSGVISKVNVDNYENVQAKQDILHLQSSTVININFQMPESMIAQVRGNAEGYQPTVMFDSLPGQEFKASYKEHSTEADPQTLSYEVKLEMSIPANFNVLPGMTATVVLEMNKITNIKGPNYLIPASSVFTDDTQKNDGEMRNVWKINPETYTAHLSQIKVGQLTNNGIEVFGGLESGDIIITAGVSNIREGMKVRAWERERGL
jgi:RND family efflux transporter MFP subunit